MKTVARTFHMRSLLEKKLFPYVMKPGRYAGGEPGQVVKDPVDRVCYLHAYPDKYEIGMSYVGLQTIYHIINSHKEFLCERVFAVDRDAEEIMRREDIPLFSLESSRSAADFDAVGFTLVDETVYTNILNMIDLSGIPLRSEDRSDRHPLVLAGGPAAYNPEPLAPFVDAFFIGDAEEGLPEILSVLGNSQKTSRSARLEALCRQVKSVYIPAFYDSDHRPLTDFAPLKIEARTVAELKPEYYPKQPLLPLIETVHNHLGVEIMRGCPQGCRFCMAGPIYRPVRRRPAADILKQVDDQLRSTGYGDITLLSLSSSDYPDIDSLATTLARRLEPQRVGISMPSLRPGSISPTLLDAIGRVRKSGLTIAPEAGTEKLRLFLRKIIPDEAIFETVRLAMERGWTTLKLYFMIGLPTETEEDLLGIARICRTVHQISREYDKKITLNVTLSPFAPKPHTPFQWDEIVAEDAVFEKIKFVKRNTKLNQVHFKYNNTKLAMLMGILGRGDRCTAGVIESAFKLGCRFDGWSEEFDYDKWLEAFDLHKLDWRKFLRAIPFSENLPWSHIQKGVSADRLKIERERTPAQLLNQKEHSTPVEIGVESTGRSASFGRSKKKLASRNLMAPTKNRVRIRWGKSAHYRYMSHLDNMRMIDRAVRRARLPVAYSQGYNPTMKLSFGPPLPLGFTSEAEYVDITLVSNLMPHMIEDLTNALPDGVLLYDARPTLEKSVSLSSAINRVIYQLPMDEWSGATEPEITISDILEASSLVVDRIGRKETRQVDIRPSIYNLSLAGSNIVMVLGMGEGGYARPTEVMRFLQGQEAYGIEALPFHRKGMYLEQQDGTRMDPMEL